ncbi:hypothetical protein LCGC14_1179210 [marine sediment metagenome]|uniref:Uncharacterized protein n=1 Tax=marine sediment metagenome TaxID=412755 RepID=A0A0F9MAI0_9ZZZZ
MKSSIINHPPNESLIIIRQWQLIFCDGNEVAAALMSFFEYWHNIKLDIKDQSEKANKVAVTHGDEPTYDTSLYQWHTEADLIAGIQRIAKTGKTLSKGLDLLESKGIITIHKNPNPHYKFDKTRHFLFHPGPINEWLKSEYRLSKSTSRLSKSTSPSSKSLLPSSKNMPAIPEITPEITPESLKAPSANADFSLPISLLSEKEVKALKLPLSAWQQHLADEQVERRRMGVLRFLDGKIATGPLLPDTPAAHTLFDKLAIEAEAKGRRPPQKFPTLAVKEKFNTTADSLNGTLESAINKALESGITAIPRIVNYISSPKWQENKYDHQNRTNDRTSQTSNKADGSSALIPVGSGQTPEMRTRLLAAFGGGE